MMPPQGHCSLGRNRQRSDLSPINSNYTRIYNNETDGNMVSSDSDYDTIYSNKEDNNNLMPIGEITSRISKYTVRTALPFLLTANIYHSSLETREVQITCNI